MIKKSSLEDRIPAWMINEINKRQEREQLRAYIPFEDVLIPYEEIKEVDFTINYEV